MHVDEQTIEVAGAPVFYRSAPVPADPALFLHSVPTSSDDWLTFLEHSGGVAPDLPGFGRTGKAGNLDYSLTGYVEFLERFVDAVELERFALVGHGWGAAIGLAFAQRHPDRVSRLVLIDAVPLLPGFSWPRIVRRWRLPGLGELLMGSVSRRMLTRTLRAGAVRDDAWTAERLEAIWEHFDQGTQRAILRLHRSVDEAGLDRAGTALAQLEQPATVLWGERDPWLPVAFADAYGERLAGARVERIAQAGHWPWLDRPEVIDRVTGLLAGAGGH